MASEAPEEIERLITDEGLSIAEAVDYYFVEIHEYTQAEWARKRGKVHGTIHENIAKAKRKLDGE